MYPQQGQTRLPHSCLPGISRLSRQYLSPIWVCTATAAAQTRWLSTGNGHHFFLRPSGQEVAFPGLSATLIVLTGIFPALAMAALGVRRLRTRAVKPLKGTWQTSWRRFTLGAVSGATLSVSLAGVLEFVLLVVLVLFTHVQGMQNMASCISTPLLKIVLLDDFL